MAGNIPKLDMSRVETPNLPGFRDNKYARSARGAGRRAVFGFKNGYQTEGAAKTERLARSAAVEKRRQALLDAAAMQKSEQKSVSAPAPTAAWGARAEAVPEALSFQAFFLESVPESRTETHRYRRFNIFVYPSDGTVTVTEIKRANSGISQGDFIKRTKVPKTSAAPSRGERRVTFAAAGQSVLGDPRAPTGTSYYGVTDFRVGSEVELYGRLYRIHSCDDRTRAYLERAHGITMEANAPGPVNTVDHMALGQGVHDWKRNFEETGGYFGLRDNEIKRYIEASRGREDRVHPDAPGGLRRYLRQGDRILRFLCVWRDDRLHGGDTVLNLNVYLKDNTMELLLPKDDRDGRDPFPALMKRGRFPKPETVALGARAWRGFSDVPSQYFEPEDLRVGQTVEFNRRRIFIFDADSATYDWYVQNCGVDMRSNRVPRSKLFPAAPAPPRDQPPPNTLGIGSEEDTLRAWKSLRPRAGHKDEQKLVLYEGKILRFHAKFSKPRYVADHDRRFIISYFLADDTLRIFEPPRANSGILGGKFLERSRIRNPATGRYVHPDDLQVGGTIRVSATDFDILSADKFTRDYKSGNFELHKMRSVDEVEALLRDKVAAAAINIRKSFRKADKDFSGAITYDEFKQMLAEMGLHLHDHDLAILMKKYDHDGDGEISYAEFCSAMIAKDYTDGEGLGRAHFHSGDVEAKDMSKDDAMSYFERMQALKISADRQRRLTSLLHEFALVFFSKGRENYARKAFRTFDVDNSGRVDRYEFACALKAGIGVTVNDRDIELLEEAFYGQDKEEIAYQDFIDFVRSHYVKVGQADEHR